MHKKLGLKCGIEIHQQLEGKKLFCSCPTLLRDDDPHFTIRRKIRASAGEGGKVDVAARQEQLLNKTFIYQGYHDTTCLVETDSEPPHPINQDALYTGLQLCKLVKAKISPVIQIMRKTVANGSNTSGFQRTGLIARKGVVDSSEGPVRIDNISIEEEACKDVSESGNEKTYRLDRLGIPLIEIGTAPDIKTPQQCQEVSKKLGMLLRSLHGVKRGIGTIRQDVNISIKGGNRIEVKGFQDLKMIPTLIELEMKRQHELLKLKDELRSVRLNPLQIIDLTILLQDVDSKRIQSIIEKGGKILGIKLHSFNGLIGRELQPNYRLGTELAGRAKVKAGVGGIFHSDELPNYGITDKEIRLIRKKLHCLPNDAFVLVVASEEKAKIALEAVYERIEQLWEGVPKEVRSSYPDGTTRYMRPMPGAARMYPETDVPLIKPNVNNIQLPELIEDKIIRFEKDYELSFDLAKLVIRNGRADLFEELVNNYPKIKKAFIADVLTSMLVEIRRKYELNSDKLTDDDFREILNYLNQDKIHKDIMLDVLIDKIKGTFSIKRYESLGTEELHHLIKEIVSKNPKAPLGALMGMCMKQLAGKASGQFISAELKMILEQGHK